MFDRRHPWGGFFICYSSRLCHRLDFADNNDRQRHRVSATTGLAGGTLLISWPTFSTPAGQSVAAEKERDPGDGWRVIGGAGSECDGHLYYGRVPT